MRDVVEVAADVRVDHDGASLEGDDPLDLADGLRPIASGTKAVGARQEVRLEDGLDHQFHRHLNHAVFDDGDAQRALFGFAGLVDPAAFHRERSVGFGVQLQADLGQKRIHPDVRLDVGDAAQLGSVLALLHRFPYYAPDSS